MVKLHWLPTKSRIDFKTLLLVFKALYHKAPQYPRTILVEDTPERSLRSSDQDLVVVSRTYMR